MRERISFDKDWMFHKGDIKPPFPSQKLAAYLTAKTDRKQFGPASPSYDTSYFNHELWTKVDLPHDYVIEEIPDQKYSEAYGFVPYHNAWYRKKFTLPEEDRGKRIVVHFEGVAIHATVYLNGCLMKHNFCGYTEFEVDISDVVKFGEESENLLAVYVSTEEHEGWWYEGGGIYRHVWLEKSDKISVDLWGIYAVPTLGEDGVWTVKTETTVRNDNTVRKSVSVLGEIVDKDGNVVATAKAAGAVEDKDRRTFLYNFKVNSPSLWSPDDPTQYVMRATLSNGKRITDVYEVKFGFRTVKLDPATGLYINGKHVKIKGLCGHADCGLLGKAVPDNVHRYKVELMKQMGANGYRTTHYPQASALMDALDENGFIVMNETRWFESTEESFEQMEMLMKRDRNRPGVIFWSMGNEEPYHATDEGQRIAQSMIARAKKLDNSRFITTAVVHSPRRAKMLDDFEVVGVNYNWRVYASIHERFPEKPVISSENCATGTTRGWYFDTDARGCFIDGYDHDTDRDWRSREYTWKFISERDWMAGGFQWIAFEHRGEAIWPRVCSQSGAIDLFMQKKDAFYQNMSHWTEKPMVHLLPHWNWAGFEGQPIKVFAYTNAERLELFLNGESVGVREIEKHGHGEWLVPYAPGTLEVKAYNGDTLVATDKKITSGAPRRLVLELDTKDVRANGEDIAILSCYAVDENGNEVYDAAPEVYFSTNSLGKLWSTGSDITEHDTLFKPSRKMRAGRIGLTVKLGKEAGTLTVRAQSAGLEAAVLNVEIQ